MPSVSVVRCLLRPAWAHTAAALCFVIGCAAARAQTMRPVTVTIQQCQDAMCGVTEGLQHGLTVIDVTGSAPRLGGSTIRLSITPSPGPELDSRATGVMASGKYTVSIPAYRFPAGRYAWTLSARGMDRPVAHGAFSVARQGGSASAGVAAHPGIPTGVWSGINGTAGTIELLPGGSYKYASTRAGRYTVSGATIAFTGRLAAWNGGRATYDGRTITFEWTRSDGGRNYFVFAK